MGKYHTKLDIPAIHHYFSHQPDVIVAYLFGSVARGQDSHLSDVDIAMLLQGDLEAEFRLERTLELIADLETFTEGKVQVTMLDQAPPLLAYQVIREGKLLYERTTDERVEFVVRVMKEYFDFKPRFDFYHRLVLENVREVGLGKRKRHPTKALDAARRVHKRLKRTAGDQFSGIPGK
jgi:predicted nucleotidyltransferase